MKIDAVREVCGLAMARRIAHLDAIQRVLPGADGLLTRRAPLYVQALAPEAAQRGGPANLRGS